MPVTTRKSKSKGLASDDIPPSETTRRTRSVTRAQTNTDPKSVASASTATKVNPKTHKSKSKLAAAHKGKKIKAAPAQLPTAEAAITTQKLSTENGVHVGCGLTQQPDPTQFGRPMPDDEVPLHPELTGGITAPLNLPPSPTPLSCCNLSPNDNTSAKPSHEVLLLPGLAGSMSAPLNPLSSPTPSSKHDDSLNGDTSPKPHIIKFRHAFYYNKGGADGKSVPSSDNELDDESLGEDQPSSPLPSRQESPAEAIRAIFDPDGNWSDHWGQEDPSDLEDNGKANNGDFNLIDDLHPEDQQQFIASHEDGKDSSSSSDDDDDSDDEGGQSDDEDERKNSKSTNRPGPISKPILKKIRTIYEEAMEMMMEISGKSAKVVLEAVAPVPTKFRRNTSAWNAFQAWYCSEHPCLKEVDFQEYKRRVREAYKKRDKSGDDELLQAFGKEIQQAIAEREDKGKHSITVKAMRKEVEKLMKFYATIGVESMMFLISPGSKAGVKSNQVITSSEKMRAVFEIQQVHLQKMLDKMNLILRNHISQEEDLREGTFKMGRDEMRHQLAPRLRAMLTPLVKTRIVKNMLDRQNFPWNKAFDILYLEQLRLVNWPFDSKGLPGPNFDLKDLKVPQLKAIFNAFAEDSEAPIHFERWSDKEIAKDWWLQVDLPLIQNPEGDTLAEVRDSRAFSNELRHDRDGKRIGGKSKPHHEEPNTDTSCADSSYGDHSKHHKPCVKGKMSAQCQVFEQQHSDMEIYEEPVCADPPVDTPERCSGRKLAAIIAKADEIAEKIRVERDCEGPEGEERDHSHQKITNLFAKYQQLVHLTSGQYEMPRDLEYASRFKEFGGDGHFHWCFNHQIPEKWLTDTPRHNTTTNKNELNRHQLKRPMPVKLMKMVTKKHTNEGIDVSDQHTAKPQHIPSKLPINQSIYPRPESTRISTRDKHGRFNGVDENEWLPKHVVISSKRRRSDDDDECEHERPTTYPRTKDALKNGDANDPEDSLSPQPQATDPLHGGDGEVDVNVLMRLFAANSSKIMARLGESSIFL